MGGKKSLNTSGILSGTFKLAVIGMIGSAVWEFGHEVSNKAEAESLLEVRNNGANYTLYGPNTIMVDENNIRDTYNFAAETSLNHSTDQRFLFAELNAEWIESVKSQGCPIAANMNKKAKGYTS